MPDDALDEDDDAAPPWPPVPDDELDEDDDAAPPWPPGPLEVLDVVEVLDMVEVLDVVEVLVVVDVLDVPPPPVAPGLGLDPHAVEPTIANTAPVTCNDSALMVAP